MFPTRNAFLFVVLMSIMETAAAPFFSVPFTMATGTNPVSVAIADINLDGRPDIIVANLGEPKLSLFTNKGGGQFSATASVSLGKPAKKVMAEDVNGDGRPDLLVLQTDYTPPVVVFTNHSAGRFTLAASNIVGNFFDDLASVDLDKDGWNELIVPDGSALRVLTNDHRGAFMISTSLFSGFYPFRVATGDFNGDGWMDVVGGNFEDAPSITTNNGAGGMVFAGFIQIAAVAGIMNVADVNHDGRLDLTVNQQLLTNNGAGVFRVAHTNITGGSYTPVAITLADFDGDGWPDVVSGGSGDVLLKVRTNDHANGFVTFAQPFAGIYASHIAAADMNGDGRPDLVVAAGMDNTVSVLLNHARLPLSIERNALNAVHLTWPVTEPPAFLETATNLLSPVIWTSLAATTNAAGNKREVQLPASQSMQFFRLRD